MRFHLPAIVESDQLLLRPPTAEDAQALFDAMLGDVETTRHLAFPRHRQLQETLDFIETARKAAEAGTRRCWLLVDKATGALAGMIDVGVSLPRVEFGAMISKRGGVRRRRASLAVLRKLVDWILEQPQVHRLYATCAVNGDAQSSMERLGFVREAVLVNHEAQPNLGLAAVDHVLFARTKPRAPSPASDPAARWLDAALGDDLSRALDAAVRAQEAPKPAAEAPRPQAVVALDDICGFDDDGMPIFHPAREPAAA
jgi:RimJ/RimL family protein N-acetyltransferase